MAEKVLFSYKENLLRYDNMSRDFGMSDAHFHNFYEVYFLVSGKCRFSVENHIYDINKNDMLIIPPGQVHMANDYFGMSSRIIIHFPKAYIDAPFKKSLNEFRQNNYYAPKNPEYIARLLERINSERKKNDSISPFMARSHLMLLLGYITRNESLLDNSKSSSLPSIKLTEELMNYVINNCHKDISLQDLADKFGYNANYISTLFKKNSGVNFKNFLILHRVKNAEYMLTTTDKSIIEIADTCGFNDSNYFSTIFKKIHGMSPREYRKSSQYI